MDELASDLISLDSVLIGFLFGFWLMRLIMVEKAYEAPAPVSTKPSVTICC